MSEHQNDNQNNQSAANKWTKFGTKMEKAGNSMTKAGKNITCGCLSFIVIGFVIVMLFILFK